MPIKDEKSEFSLGHYLYGINDSGNDNLLFRLDQDGSIINEISIPDSNNIDWEDLTFDSENNIYIGDFGNNSNSRKDLVIYKVSGITTNNPTTSKTEFFFEDQKKFPPKKNNLNYDVEAFIYFNKSFYLFTKNRSKNFNGITKLYKLPASSGKHIAKLVGTFTTCNDDSDCFITGAAINPNSNKIVLLTYNKLFILTDFNEDNLFNGNIQKIKLHHYSQKEGISFKNDSILFITDESSNKNNASLYEYLLN